MAEPHLTRVCTQCLLEKPATPEHFHAYKRAPDGRRAVCRLCRAKDHAAHREERLPQRREHYKENRERLNAAVRAYYQAHADEQRAAGLQRHYKNRETRLEQMRAYREKYLEQINGRRRGKSGAIWRQRYGVDIEFTLKHRVSALVRATLTQGRDGMRMREILGYGAAELRAHLARQFSRGMTWDRFMAGEIHIDHIVPVSSFDIKGPTCPEFRACWSLANLRPMWAKENLSKGAKVLTLL